jgi:hypothetical protein
MTNYAKLEKMQKLEARHIDGLANCYQYQYSARVFYHHVAGSRVDAERARQWLGNEVEQLVLTTNELSDFLKTHASDMQRARNQLAERMHSVHEVLAMYNLSITLF